VNSWPGLMLGWRAALSISAPRRLATGPEHPGAARHPDHSVVPTAAIASRLDERSSPGTNPDHTVDASVLREVGVPSVLAEITRYG
jgi:hypothetical protein